MSSAKFNRQFAETEPPSIAAVVVTHNRLSLLQEAVAALRSQTVSCQQIFVVDNASDDGTADWLHHQADLTVIRQNNQGSAGGQATGILAAYHAGHDWFWCMDDDTRPESDALAAMTRSPAFSLPDTGYLASLVLWTDGTPHRMNLPCLQPAESWLGELVTSRQLGITTASFVSILVSRRAVQAVGLPQRELFLWCDDTEFTQRISARFPSYLIVDSVAVHQTARNQGAGYDPAQPSRYFRLLRNRVLVIKREPVGWPVKVRRITGLFLRELANWLAGQGSWQALVAIVRGLFFRPKIEPVEAGQDRHQP